MAHFVRQRPDAAWITPANSQFHATEALAFDQNQYASINGDGGGVWSPSSAIVLGGSGLAIYGATFWIGDGVAAAQGVVTATSTFTIASSGFLTASAGSTTSLAGNTNITGAGVGSAGGAGHHVRTGCTFWVDNGGTISVGALTDTTAKLDVWGVCALKAGSTFNLSGAYNIQSGSNGSVASGALLSFFNQTKFDVGSELLFQSTSTATLKDFAALHLKGSSTFLADAGTQVTINSELAGDYNRTAVETISGSGALTNVRVGMMAAVSQTVDTSADVWLFPSPGAGLIFTMVNGPATGSPRIRIACYQVCANEVQINTPGGLPLIKIGVVVGGAGTAGLNGYGSFVDLIWYAGSWLICGGYPLL